MIHLENAIRTIRYEYFAILVTVVTDASGECCKAQQILALRYPNIIFLDCYAHQVLYSPPHLFPLLIPPCQINLVVGDYFKSKTSVLVFADDGMELISWLRSKTQILALMRDVQARLDEEAVETVICAVLT